MIILICGFFTKVTCSFLVAEKKEKLTVLVHFPNSKFPNTISPVTTSPTADFPNTNFPDSNSLTASSPCSKILSDRLKNSCADSGTFRLSPATRETLLFISEAKFTRTDLPVEYQGRPQYCYSMLFFNCKSSTLCNYMVYIIIMVVGKWYDDVIRLLQFQNDLVLVINIDCRLYSYLLALYKLLAWRL